MSEKPEVTQEEVRALYQQLNADAQAAGYNLNPDEEFTLGLVEGLLVNERRYGYQACPCRLADGVREKDLDLICPCDYRDEDLVEFGACYCALYVSDAVRDGDLAADSIPDRRPPGGPTAQPEETHTDVLIGFTRSGIPVWRCKVCGYLCARAKPPLKCPICKADRDRFERFG
ncbi:MAG: ferredoxin:glutaredoxin reductase [Anaerolineae bacterium]|nr:ferredoxin:glutaredoxin reductase [Anaerolineae bacterium]